MESTNNLDNPESSIDEVKTTRCEQRFKIFSDYREAFGENFDNLLFLNYSTGKNDVKGAELRDVQIVVGASGGGTGDWRCLKQEESQKHGFRQKLIGK